MGYHIPKGAEIEIPTQLLIANTRMAKQQVVGNHPDSTLYQLLMGGTESTRDVIAAGHVLTSLFLMDIKPGGTNDPHHHATEEEIYVVLEGKGVMVAGGGADGLEGRHPATAGDTYFIRLNATVGFYADPNPESGNARILAVRSKYPFPRR
jgi:mannose-6-phosphate isomerase-like protein (cupin superfamily)